MAKRPKRLTLLSIGAGIAILTLILGIFLGPSLTVRGVPISIILTFLQDEPARQAYWSGDKQALHARLQELKIEEEIKAFYRPQIPDEIQLDQHIHQIFYDTTGYVGKAYWVNSQDILTLRDRQFEKWYPLAHKAGVVTNSLFENGTHYVIGPDGTIAPYQEIAKLFPIPVLQQLIEVQSTEVLPRGKAS
ncbi:MAG: hypothetical protein HC851_07715 [Acaryochloris sp. RU_4_1]|nr:hypothetical protein [Acaryochloris sp. SU_5_25]NJM65555.1 hypothetical protein [Acaryochloris sp. RU_4_1]NJR54403.1 hypothetical protein [Acaryochloris sp. CRU_2_0]